MTDRLLPCPFCGGEAVETIAGVSCTTCGGTMHGGVQYGGADWREVVAAWNTRAELGKQGYYTDRDDNGTHIMCARCGEYIGTAEEIAATLGNGTLTAEQVCEAIMSADRWEKPMGNTGLTNTHLIIRDDGWQEIADMLNTRAERTCRVKAGYDTADVDNRGSNAEWYFAFTCGCELYWDEPEPPSYCPNCGAKVVDE